MKIDPTNADALKLQADYQKQYDEDVATVNSIKEEELARFNEPNQNEQANVVTTPEQAILIYIKTKEGLIDKAEIQLGRKADRSTYHKISDTEYMAEPFHTKIFTMTTTPITIDDLKSGVLLGKIGYFIGDIANATQHTPMSFADQWFVETKTGKIFAIINHYNSWEIIGE